jgi:type VI secretion system secreted protein VgrG
VSTSTLSPTTRPTQNLELQVDSSDVFDVREFKVDEGINTLFTVDLVVRCTNPAIDLAKTIGVHAGFRIGMREGATASPHWTGVVSSVELLASEETGLSTYRFRLAPAFWLLTHRTNCRVFQQMTDLEVVLAMLAEWGLPHESLCQGSYKTRKYRVQYQESDFAFVSRLLEDSGISYVLEQREEGTVLVLRDVPEAVSPRETPLESVSEPTAGQLYATGFQRERVLRQGRTTFADHDPRLPNQPLLAQASTSEHPIESQLESFLYTPGAFKFGIGNGGPSETPTADDRGRSRTDIEEARRLAAHDAASRVARSQRFSFRSNCLELRSGTTLRLSNHPTSGELDQFLLTHVAFSGTSHSEVEIAVRAVSGDVPFRPTRTTPRPNIPGIECATVVGPDGETIHTDEFGRVRVQFHWDRYGNANELSSCWVPVSEPWAGEGFGSVNLPRIGQEVLVTFLGGNPEEPVIVGRVFTNLRRPPFALPVAKNESGFRSKSVPETGGYNLLRYVDTAGEELVEGRAEKDMLSRVNNDKSLSVGHDRKMDVENDDEERVLRTQREFVGKDKTERVADNVSSVVGKDRTLKTIGGMLSHAKTHSIVAEDSIHLVVGNSSIYMDREKIVVTSTVIKLDHEDPRHHREEGIDSVSALTGRPARTGT